MKRFRRQRAEYKAPTTYIFPRGEFDTVGMSINGLERNGFSEGVVLGRTIPLGKAASANEARGSGKAVGKQAQP